jgi:hypothetical protein
MRRLIVAVALLVGLLGAPTALGHSALAHSGCLRHSTLYFDYYAGGKYWYHRSAPPQGGTVQSYHYSRVAGDPVVGPVHYSFAYNCR